MPTRAPSLAIVALVLLAGCSGKGTPEGNDRGDEGIASQTETDTVPGVTIDSAKGESASSEAHLIAVLTLPALSIPIYEPTPVRIAAMFTSADGKQVEVSAANWTLSRPTAGDAPIATGSTLPADATLVLDHIGPQDLVVAVASKLFGVARLVVGIVGLAPVGCTERDGDQDFSHARPLAPVTVGSGAGEPGLALSREGVVYVQAVSTLFRSVDGGLSFTNLGGDGIQGHSDGDLVVDAGGRIHWVGLHLPAAGNGAVYYQTSADQGKTFSEPEDISEGGARDRQWLDIRPNGTLYASWRDEAGIVMRTSHDLGSTWGPKRTVAEETPLGPILHGPVPGHVYQPIAPFRSPVGATQEVLVARSFDDGGHWENRVAASFAEGPSGVQNIANSLSIFPVLAIDRACTMYLVYSVEKQAAIAAPEPVAQFGVYLVKSLDFGETWTPPQLISPSEKVAVMPWIVAGAPGNIAVAWYENVLGLAHETVPDEWHVQLWVSGNADGATPQGTRVQLTTEPSHLGTICPGGGACLAGGDRSLLDYFELALTPTGDVVGVWASSTLGIGTGNSAQGTQIHFGGLQPGTPLS